MNPPSNPAFPPVVKKRAVALVIVLVMLVLMAVLIVAFYSSVKTELVSATSYASGADARNLGDSAVQLAQAQIAAATRGLDAANKPLLWASQPGMIRTWTSDATGSAGSFYKLYSSASMVVPGTGFSMAAEAPPADWATQTARYVDLNAPALVQDAAGLIAANGGTYSARYPIMDPALAAPKNGSGDVEGFEIDGAPGYAGSYPPAADYNPAKDPNPAAMPVEWLYQLADGTITTPTFDPGTPGKISSFNPVPTQTNPITSRLAFWTDDETAKINVNTASEGTFWDMPRAATQHEMALARNIPVQNEYERVPGHPAGVSLSPVLSRLLPRTQAASLDLTSYTLWDNASINEGYKQIKPYLRLTPRINYESILQIGPDKDKTSRAGTSRTTLSPPNTTKQPSTARPVSLDAARLYATVDEFLFSDGYNPSKERMGNTDGDDVEFFGATTAAKKSAVVQNISRYRFFLTANGRADETTPFNTPKVAVWPLPVLPADTDATLKYKPTKDWRNAKDRLIAKASTIGDKSYFFQRENVATDLFAAAQLSSANKNFDYAHITRNRQLYGYLQNLTNGSGGFGPIPGCGKNFTDKWTGLGRDRVLTQIFDVIRSQVNILKFKADTAGEVATYKENLDTPNPQFAFDPMKTGDPLIGKVGAKYIVPIEIPAGPSGTTPTRGFGRYMTITEATLVFHTWTVPATAGPPVVPEKRLLRAVLYFQPYTPSPQPSTRFSARIRVRGMEDLAITNKGGTVPAPNLHFPSDVIFRFDPGSGFGNVYGAFRSPGAITSGKKFRRPVEQAGSPAGTYNEDSHYPLISDALDITNPTNPDDWEWIKLISTATIKIDILNPVSSTAGTTGTVTPEDVLQTINLDFPPTGNMALVATSGSKKMDIDASAGSVTPDDQDISRSIVFLGSKSEHRGDLRLLALTPVVPKTWFDKHPDYDEPMTIPAPAVNLKNSAYTNGRFAHSLRDDYARDALGPQNFLDTVGSAGKAISANTVGVDSANRLSTNGDTAKKGGLAETVRLTQPSQPVAPIKMAAALGPGLIPGDWASSFGFNPDGSVITPVDMSTSLGWLYGGYFGGNTGNVDNGSLYEPTRMISSAVNFGDLLTPNALGDLQGWQTLLFNPVPAGDTAHTNYGKTFKNNPHYGSEKYSPPDHLLLENFWMPIVEPYALSESFSTTGKVNPNYQIAPFTYLHRSTGLRGALKSIRLGAIPENDPKKAANDYKSAAEYKWDDADPIPDWNTTINSMKTRYALNLARLDGTIKIYEDFFNNGDNALRTASEVCTLPLIPTGSTVGTLSTFWETNRLTSDTLRESPYKQLYSRLTTKSNTYTVHYRVQALTQTPRNVAAGTWEEGKDMVRAEYRGATTIERYIDPNTPGLPDYATDPAPAPLGNFARFRTLSNRQFTP